MRVTVSFMKDTLFNMVLSNIKDTDIKEKCLPAAYLKTVTNIDELVEFCSADKSCKIAGCNTLGGLHRASIYKNATAEGQRQAQPNAPIQQEG